MNIDNSIFLDALTSEGEVTFSRGWEGQNPRYGITINDEKRIKVYVTNSFFNPLVSVEVYIDGYFKTKVIDLTKKQARAIRKHCKTLYDERAKVNKEMWAKYYAEQAAKPQPIDIFLKDYYSDRSTSQQEVGNDSELPVTQ